MSKNKIILISIVVVTVLVLGAGGYWGYSVYTKNNKPKVTQPDANASTTTTETTTTTTDKTVIPPQVQPPTPAGFIQPKTAPTPPPLPTR